MDIPTPIYLEAI